VVEESPPQEVEEPKESSTFWNLSLNPFGSRKKEVNEPPVVQAQEKPRN